MLGLRALVVIALLLSSCTRAFYTPMLSLRVLPCRSSRSSKALLTMKVDYRDEINKRIGEIYAGPDLSLIKNSDLTEDDYEELELAMNEDDHVNVRKGSLATGIITNIDDDGAYVQMAGKFDAFIPIAEASINPVTDMNTIFKVGQEVTAEIVGFLHGMPVMSPKYMELDGRWDLLENLMETQKTVTAEVVSVGRFGASCTLMNMKAFLPGSHYALNTTLNTSAVGSSIEVKILDADREETKIVLSQKLVDQERAGTFERNSILQGTVMGLKDFGVFVLLPRGVMGLLHKSQISCERVESLAQLFTIGESIKVQIKEHDRVANKIMLCTKNFEVTPGDMLRNKTLVFENAEVTLAKKLESDAKMREEFAKSKNISRSLKQELDTASASQVLESIESILSSFISPKKST